MVEKLLSQKSIKKSHEPLSPKVKWDILNLSFSWILKSSFIHASLQDNGRNICHISANSVCFTHNVDLSSNVSRRQILKVAIHLFMKYRSPYDLENFPVQGMTSADNFCIAHSAIDLYFRYKTTNGLRVIIILFPNNFIEISLAYTNCVYLMYTIWCFYVCIHCVKITTVKVNNLSITSI